MGWIGGARSRASAWAAQLKLNELPAWWRRRDKSAERAAVATRASPFLGALYTWLAWTAWFLEFGFATLWALRANGEIDWTWRVSLGGGDWSFNFAAHVLPASLTTLAVGLIVAISVTWIPVFNALRGMGRLRRASVLVVGPLCTSIAILGAIVVQVENVSMDARDAAIIEQQAGQDREALIAQRGQVQARLDALIDPGNNSFQAQAARAGVAGWDVYIETARRQYAEGLTSAGRLALIESARGSAVAVAEYQRQIDELTGRIAAAPVAAQLESTTSEVQDGQILGWVQWANDHRIVLIGVTLSIVGLLCLWQAQGLREAAALLNPDAPEDERKLDQPEEPAPDPSAVDNDALNQPATEEFALDLPPLPDLRGQDDPEFDALGATVDEEGRVLKRFSGWRAPAKTGRDKRRAPEPAGDTMAMADIDEPAPAEGGDELDDILADMKSRARPAEAAPAEESVE